MRRTAENSQSALAKSLRAEARKAGSKAGAPRGFRQSRLQRIYREGDLWKVRAPVDVAAEAEREVQRLAKEMERLQRRIASMTRAAQ